MGGSHRPPSLSLDWQGVPLISRGCDDAQPRPTRFERDDSLAGAWELAAEVKEEGAVSKQFPLFFTGGRLGFKFDSLTFWQQGEAHAHCELARPFIKTSGGCHITMQPTNIGFGSLLSVGRWRI